MSSKKEEPNLERLKALVAEHLRIITAERILAMLDLPKAGNPRQQPKDWCPEGPVKR